MKFLKIIFLCALGSYIISFLFICWLKYSTFRLLDKDDFSDLVSSINTSPAIPASFKTTYSKVYPGTFESKASNSILRSLFGKRTDNPPSWWIANRCWPLFESNESAIFRKLRFIAFTEILEDSCSQEKCFDAYLERFDFGYCTRGPWLAAYRNYGKSLDELDEDQRLGLILLIRNPTYFDKRRFRERYAEELKRMKEKIVSKR